MFIHTFQSDTFSKSDISNLHLFIISLPFLQEIHSDNFIKHIVDFLKVLFLPKLISVNISKWFFVFVFVVVVLWLVFVIKVDF